MEEKCEKKEFLQLNNSMTRVSSGMVAQKNRKIGNSGLRKQEK